MIKIFDKLVVILLIASSLSACSGRFGALQVDDDVIPHMIAIDANGETFKIEYVKTECKRLIGTDCSDEQLINFHIDEIYKELTIVGANNQKINILLFIHGGLVSKRTAVLDAQNITHIINDENIKNIKSGSNIPYLYPIFVNWESSMGASYANHLFKIRQGERSSRWFGWPTSPFYLIGDAGRAISRTPITYTYQAYNMIKPLEVYNPSQVLLEDQKFYIGGRNIGHSISLGRNTLGKWSQRFDKLSYIFPGVFKLFTTPVLDQGNRV